MYRETFLGSSLATALAEVRTSMGIADNQERQIWELFDKTMDEVLMEAPLGSSITVRPNKKRRVEPTAPTSKGISEEASVNNGDITVALSEENLPVFREVDGRFTVLLKDVDVTVQEVGGAATETIHLDVLKCHIKSFDKKGSKKKK